MAKDLLETYKAVFNASIDAVVVVDYYGIVVMVNDQALQMFGYKRNELIGNSVETLIPNRFTKSHQEQRKTYSDKPKERPVHSGYVLTATKKDGSEFYVEIGLRPVKVGKKTFMAAFIRNVTTEKTVEIKFQKMIEDIQDYSILFTDIDGNITNWNKGVMSIKGYSEEEVLNKNFSIFYTEEDQKARKPEKLLDMAILEGRAEEEGWQVRKDGSIFWAFVSITAIQDKLQHFIGFSMLTRDLSQRKLADDLLKKQAEELRKKNKELEHFAYIASHDLQEPLSTVTSMIDLINDEDPEQLSEDTRTYFSFMEDAVWRMRNLVKGLLDYSRLGRNRKLVSVDLNEVLEDVQKDLKNRIESIEATIIIGKMPTMKVFDVEIRLVFQNLLSNALKFIKPGSKPIIKVKAEDCVKYWKFSVKDNGIGIQSRYIGKVFTIFQRLNDHSAYEGTGIRLAHCKKVVEMHDGTIWVSSVYEKGSTFFFTIPKQINQDVPQE